MHWETRCWLMQEEWPRICVRFQENENTVSNKQEVITGNTNNKKFRKWSWCVFGFPKEMFQGRKLSNTFLWLEKRHLPCPANIMWPGGTQKRPWNCLHSQSRMERLKANITHGTSDDFRHLSARHFHQLLNCTESWLYKFKIMLSSETYLIEPFYVSDEVKVL